VPEGIASPNRKRLNLLSNIFKKDIVFTIAFIMAITSCFLYVPKLEYIDFKVLFSLFNLMLVIKALEELKILDKFAVGIVNKCSDYRQVSLILILLCFFSSMLITNDVALITFVPLTLIISRKTHRPMVDTIILQTLAANIGSSLTPMGNPQNLFIFSFYKLTITQFFMTVGLFVLLGGVWLYILNYRIKRHNIVVELDEVEVKNQREAFIWIGVFCVIIASILGGIDYKLAIIVTILAVLAIDLSLLGKIDYLLLATFVCFFVFIGNVSHIPAINSYMREHLTDSTSVYVASIFSSQFISNVPSAILLSRFTDNWKPLLLGVNIGGMGTLVASLASVISYKLFIKDNPGEGKKYILKFSLYNLVSLVILAVISYLILNI
jgi:Na+/H+ antiporter NhaD/arsenite permease-like protein